MFHVSYSVATRKEGMNSGQRCWRRHMPSALAAFLLFLVVIDYFSGYVEQSVDCVCVCLFVCLDDTFNPNDV